MLIGHAVQIVQTLQCNGGWWSSFRYCPYVVIVRLFSLLYMPKMCSLDCCKYQCVFEGIIFLRIIMTVVKVAKDNWPLQDSTMLQDPIKPCFKTIWSFIVEHGNITFRLSSSLALTVDHYCTFEKLNQMGASLPSETLLLSVFIKEYRQYRWLHQLPVSTVVHS